MASCAAEARRTIQFLMRRWKCTAVTALVLLLAAGSIGAEQVRHDPRLSASLARSRDGCAWQPGFFLPDFDGNVYAMTVFDDGSGPALYAGGWFTSASGVVANRIARWDGTVWSALSGPYGTGVSGYGSSTAVESLVVFDDGSGPALYAGGYFTTAGGVVVNGVARWDGTAWSGLSGPSGTGVDSTVWALTVFDDGSGPALYAGGDFTNAGGVTVNGVARWNGSAWSALSGPPETGIDGTVCALAVFDDGTGPALYAGGEFTTAGGVTVNSIARWDGTDWCALGGPSADGVDGIVTAFTIFDDGSGSALFVGGAFATAGGVAVNSVARWDGTAWSALSGPYGTGVGGYVYALGVFDGGSGPALCAGGVFPKAGDVTVNNIALWDGAAWSALNGPLGTGVNGYVYALAVFDDSSGTVLHVGGELSSAGGVEVNSIARWSGSAWSALRGPSGAGVNDWVTALTVLDNGSGPALYAGGNFTTAGGVTTNYVARWDGITWSALSGPSGTGVSDYVFSLAVFDDGSGPALYAGGLFTIAGGVEVNYVARWDGTTWSPLSGPSWTGVDSLVFALTDFDDGSGPALYAGGTFTTAGGVTVNGVARWDGTAWSALGGPSGTGVSGRVDALAVFDDGSGPALYAGGYFVSAGGVTVNGIARWDGTAWSALSGPSGVGVDGGVHALAVFDDGSGPSLFAGGFFTTAGEVPVNFIARWDGSAWSAVSGPYGTGADNGVEALAVFDDGSGPGLYAGGNFTTAGGVTVNSVARWDGTAWSDLSGPSGTGVNEGVGALAVFDDSSGPVLYAGCSNTLAGGLVSSGIAAWRCAPDLTPPSDPTLASTTHTPGVWASADVIEVSWNGATDRGGSLLAGYSFLFDDLPDSLPDTTIDLPHIVDPHSTQSPVQPNGQSHWFHLRTADGAGNWSSGVHLGPFWIDATVPSNPPSLASTTHTPSVWSSSNIVSVQWSGATDSGGSGLAGYSFLFDTNPTTEPDSTIDLPQVSDPHSTSSGALADGKRHWFHIRTCDVARACSPGLHLGPFWIDATPPSGPLDFTSTSHTPYQPSSDRTVDLVWSPAVDAGSGLDGYAMGVSASALWVCDQVKDLEEGAASLTTADLTDNPWYVHLCAVDNVGNWGAVVSAGPFVINGVFADGFESGDTTRWSLTVP